VLSFTRGAAFHRAALVWFVTIDAAHVPLHHRMMMRQLKLRAHIQVTCEAGLRRFPWIDDQVRRAAALRMKTSGTVTGLTADVRRVGTGRLQPRMRGGDEVAHDLLVAMRAFLGADKFRARNTGRRHYRAIAIECAAGKQSDCDKACSTAAPEQSQPVSIDP